MGGLADPTVGSPSMKPTPETGAALGQLECVCASDSFQKLEILWEKVVLGAHTSGGEELSGLVAGNGGPCLRFLSMPGQVSAGPLPNGKPGLLGAKI